MTHVLTTLQPMHMNSRSFYFNDPTPTEIYTLSLHDALPIFHPLTSLSGTKVSAGHGLVLLLLSMLSRRDRKSTRLNSSHSQISYAVFCLKKKKNNRAARDDQDVPSFRATG